MYKVYCDGVLLYHSKLENLQIFSPSLELELNKTGSFEFGIYPSHPRYSLIKKLRSIITVYQDDYLLFRGRVLDDEIGFHNEKHVTCEGELAFLLDSIQRPYDFTGGVTEFLTMLITNHNVQVDEEKRFALGNVTVTDPNDYIVRSDIDYVSTWEVINKKLLEMLGGFLFVRHDNGQNIIDYLAESTLLSPQKITFGKNLLDLKRIRKGGDIATVVIPIGAKLKNEEGQDTDKRLTIESVNGGVDFVQDADAIAQFGTIVKTVIFDDVTDAENLKTKGQAHLAGLVKQLETIELTAADLATVDKDITSFHLGTQVRVDSNPHGINQLFTVSKLSLKLLDPAANKLTLGKTVAAFSEAVKGVSDGQGVILQTVEKTAQAASEAVYNVERNLLSSIQASEESVKSTVAENYYLKEDTLEYKLQSATAWTNLTSGAVYALKDSIISASGIFGLDNSYDVRLSVTDHFTTVRSIIDIPTAFTLLDFNASGRAVAFGKVSELTEGIEFALKTVFSHAETPSSVIYLTEGQDLNEILEPGFYSIPTSAVSGALLNKPYSATSTGSLIVLREGNGVQKAQILHVASKANGAIYERCYYSSAWGEWKTVYNGGGKILWEGAMYMTASHKITLAEAISKQPSGIVLVFSRYDSATSTPSEHNYNSFFVHKALVAAKPGVGSAFCMNTVNYSMVATKYLYINDTTIAGNDSNDDEGTGNGVTYNNKAYVLRYVIGV